MKKIELFDTTLRDGIQGIDINFSLADKILATRKLDDLMIDFIEGGFPSSNKKDASFSKQSAASFFPSSSNDLNKA